MKPSLINPRYIIVLFALLAFAPTLRVGFLVDDHRVIENNVTLTRWSWQDIREDFASNVFHDATEANYYRPLFNCLLRAEHSLWRFQPFGYHAINLLFHIACALALFQLLTTLGMSQNIALAAASLFAVHPVATDLMMVASAGEEQMAYFLSLLSILLAQGGRRRYGGALLVFCAALFTKESAMMTPILFAAVLIAKGSPPQGTPSMDSACSAGPPLLWMAQARDGADDFIVRLASGISFFPARLSADPGPLHRRLFLALFTSLPSADTAAVAALASLLDRMGAFDGVGNQGLGSHGRFLPDMDGGRAFTQNPGHDSRFFNDGSLVLPLVAGSAVAPGGRAERSVGFKRHLSESVRKNRLFCVTIDLDSLCLFPRADPRIR